MSIFHYHYLHLLLLALLLILSLYPSPSLSQNDTAPCPLNFTLLTQFATTTNRPDFDVSNECQYILQGLRLVQSHYLQLTNSFVPPFNSSESCWSSYQSYLSQSLPNFNILTSCGFQSIWISLGCMNITTRSDFEKIVPKSALNDVVASCNQSLENSSPCASCLTSLSSLQASYLTGPSVGNVSVCTAYPSIYAAAFSNRFGPLDQGTAQCLFSLGFTSIKSSTSKRRKVVVVLAVLIGCAV